MQDIIPAEFPAEFTPAMIAAVHAAIAEVISAGQTKIHNPSRSPR